MGRILGIDYGIKRTGLAITDETKVFAFGLSTVPTLQLSAYLSKFVLENDVEGFVVGEPKNMRNLPTDASPHVEGFIRRLKKEFPGKVIFRIDERFTSSLASQAIIESGIKKKGRRDKSIVDMVSATIILQSWIEQQKEH